jgi:hypothetical protein
MSFVKLQPENFDTFSLTLRPRAEFTSSSLGVTGSIRLIERPSVFNKEIITLSERTTYAEGLSTLDDYLAQAAANPSTRTGYLESYLAGVNSQIENQKNEIILPVVRTTQSIDFDRNSLTKSTVKNILMPQYRSVYTDCDYSYKNYHTINFFTASTVPSDSAIIYPNINNQYAATGAFSLDFYINPRYTTDSGSDFKAGTIFHMSSSLCISLLTGSSRNANDQADRFRIAVAFKHSANIAPDNININQANGTRTYPQDLIYVSEDNVLKYNNWHHVSVRWGANHNNRSGSITIDDSITSFMYPSSSTLIPGTFQTPIVLGNFYSGSQTPRAFFNVGSSINEGIPDLFGVSDPTNFTFNNPLNAEIHDIKFFNRVLSNQEVQNYRSNGANLEDEGLVFYVPPIFTNFAIKSQKDYDTPTSKSTQTPSTPHNVSLAASTQVFSPNLQNFLFDVKNYAAPRLYNLTSSTEAYAGEEFAVDHMFREGVFIKRAYTILPNDNGLFVPNFGIVPTGSSTTDYAPYVDSNDNDDKTAVSLLRIDTSIPAGSLGSGSVDLGSYLTPTNYGAGISATAGNTTTLFSFGEGSGSYADTSSNLSTIYQISNLYYGNQIFPETFTLSSTALTGSGGKINLSLKDNGFGGLYRADAVTPAPTWATIGNLFYDEGLAIIKTPHLYYFGKDNFSVSFNGHQNVHTYTIDAICPAGEINSSSNPSYLSFPPTNEQNETADNFVYITGINIHDDNFNVIMRANLAQPVLKRPDEEFLFRLKYDM